MKVLSLIGARPQFIKEAILQEQFEINGIQEIVVHSGQHYDYNMSDAFFKVLKMRKPDYNLNVKLIILNKYFIKLSKFKRNKYKIV